jgi:hypothetical protein
MSELDGFFTKKHDRLLAIAVWAKYLAWIVLVVFILLAITTFIGNMNMYRINLGSFDRPIDDFSDLIRQLPGSALNLILESVSTLVKGVIYFLVLKGISLGLNMIIETDLNYRGKNFGEVGNE